MNNRLYFVPILSGAVEQHDLTTAIREAFREIESLGRRSDYELGYRQFLTFLDYVRLERISYETLQDIPDVLDEDNEAVIQLLVQELGQPELERTMALVHDAMVAADDSLRYVEFILEMDGAALATARLPIKGGSFSFPGATAGTYCLKLGTGRELWKAALHRHDLVWAEALQGKPLEMAADVGEVADPTPSRIIHLLNGEVVLRVFAGLEAGRIVVTLARKRPK